MLDLLPLGSFPLIQIPLVKGSYENILDFFEGLLCCVLIVIFFNERKAKKYNKGKLKKYTKEKPKSTIKESLKSTQKKSQKV
jgi:hypothetical protein